jgi:hypothetical protein
LPAGSLEDAAGRLVGRLSDREDQNPTPPPPPDVVVVVVGGGGGVVVGGEVGGVVVGGAVGGGLVGAGLVGAGLLGLPWLPGLAGADVGRVVVEEEEGLDPGVDVGGTVTLVPALFVRLSVPFDLTVNQLFTKPCPPACDAE